MKVIIPTIRANPKMLRRCIEIVRDSGIEPTVAEGGTFAQNCNSAAIGDDLLLFLNDDTEPQSGWLEPIVAAFDDEKVGIVGCKLIYPNGSLQHAGVGFRDNNGIEAFNITFFDFPTRDVEAVTGACMAVRTSMFDDLGGFDEGFRNGYEDIDLCLRASLAGWRIVYVAESVVVHHESQSGPARWTHVRDNIARLQERWQ